MALDMDKILNQNFTKVLMREFEELKKDYTKLGAIKYKELYENASLSDILINSRFIFAEPIRGYDFYKSFMENTILPLGLIESEYVKIDKYIQENSYHMSDEQKELYHTLLESVNAKISSVKNTMDMYNYLGGKSNNLDFYDALYEYQKNPENKAVYDILPTMMEREESFIDTVIGCLALEDTDSDLYLFLNQFYKEAPSNEREYGNLAYLENVFNIMMKDKYYREQVQNLHNMNLRDLILGLAGNDSTDTMRSITEKTEAYEPMFSTGENAVYKIFEDTMYDEIYAEENAKEKLDRLLCEKAVAQVDLAFLIMHEFTYDDEDKDPGCHNALVEKICIESSEIEKIPQTYAGQIEILENYINSLDEEITNLNEKYFGKEGTPNAVISRSIGQIGKDPNDSRKEAEDRIHYASLKKDDGAAETEDNGSDADPRNAEPDLDKDSDDEDDESYQKRQDAKKRQTDKYANMSIDDMGFPDI